jgi:hypothetical protein
MTAVAWGGKGAAGPEDEPAWIDWCIDGTWVNDDPKSRSYVRTKGWYDSQAIWKALICEERRSDV